MRSLIFHEFIFFAHAPEVIHVSSVFGGDRNGQPHGFLIFIGLLSDFQLDLRWLELLSCLVVTVSSVLRYGALRCYACILIHL